MVRHSYKLGANRDGDRATGCRTLSVVASEIGTIIVDAALGFAPREAIGAVGVGGSGAGFAPLT